MEEVVAAGLSWVARVRPDLRRVELGLVRVADLFRWLVARPLVFPCAGRSICKKTPAYLLVKRRRAGSFFWVSWGRKETRAWPHRGDFVFFSVVFFCFSKASNDVSHALSSLVGVGAPPPTHTLCRPRVLSFCGMVIESMGWGVQPYLSCPGTFICVGWYLSAWSGIRPCMHGIYCKQENPCPMCLVFRRVVDGTDIFA